MSYLTSRPLGRAGLCAFLFFLTGAAMAQTTDPAVANGATWLQGQVQSDGSLSNENQSIATPLQGRAEAAAALAIAATAPASLINAVSTDAQINTDYLSRRAIALQAAQQNSTALVSALTAARNPDGGWGNATGYATDALDTAMSLTALCGSNASSATITPGLTTLQNLQVSDGGFGLTDVDDLYVSLWSLRALEACATSALAQSETSLTTWLLSQRNGSGDYGDVEFNSLGFLTLLGRTSDSTILTPFVTALHNAQLADGSWGDDPYLTALAVEALYAASHFTPPATTGAVTGRVADSNGNPLPGATVELLEATQFATTSAEDGSFTLSGVAPGSYTVQAQIQNYSPAQKAAIVSAGTTVDIGTLTFIAAPLTATLTGHVQNSSNAPIANALITVGSVYIATDASGNYTISGISPGVATITISADSYQSATASVTFAAGTTYVFSPTLYTSAPPVTSITGKIVDANTSATIAGAQIALGSQTVTSAADGTFTLTNVSAGSFSMSVTASNYLPATFTGVLGDGANNLGAIALTSAPTTSTLSGTVTDSASGNPITGATVSIQGTALQATTDAAGHYSIDSITQTTFVVSVSASGYQTQQGSVQLGNPGPATLNVALVATTASNVSFTSITTSAPQYAPNDSLKIDITAANGGTAAVDLVIEADVLDAQNNVVVALMANPAGAPGSVVNQPITIAAGASISRELAYHLLHEAAGPYTVKVRGFSTTGQVLAEGTATFTITAAAILGGTVNPDPPMLQAGTNTPVHATALLANLGNQMIPAGNAQLTVTLDSLDDSYNPADQANLRLIAAGTAAYTANGAAVGPDGSIYTVVGSHLVKTTPAGQMSVAYNMPSYSAVDLAIDGNGTFWFVGSGSKIGTLKPDGTFSTFQLATPLGAAGIAVDAAGNQYYSGNTSTSTLLKRDPQGNETILWQGGFNGPVGIATNPDGTHVVSNYGNGSLVQVGLDGSIAPPFATGLSNPQGIALGPDGNYYVANSGNNAIAKVTPAGVVSTYASGLNGPYGLVFNSQGELIVSDQGDDSILKVHADGTTSVIARSFMSEPQAIIYGPDSSLYVAQADGTVKRTDPQGNVTALAAGLGDLRSIAVDASSVAYVTSFNTGRVERVSTSGAQDFVTQLKGPTSIAYDATDQYLAVVENNTNQLHWYSTAGTELGHVENVLDDPAALALDPSGNLFVANRTFVTAVSSTGNPTIFARGVAATSLAYNPVSGKVDALVGTSVVEIASNGTTTTIGTPPANSLGLAIDDLGRALVADGSRANVYRSDGTGTFSLLTALPAGETVASMTSSTTGVVYLATNNHKIYRLIDDATLTLLATWNWDITSLGVGLDGRIALFGYYSANAAIVAPDTGVITTLSNTGMRGSSCCIAFDGHGNLALTESSGELRTYDLTGTLLSEIDEFAGPAALIWTGSDFRFWDSGHKLFSWKPGSYPVYSGWQINPGALAWQNGKLYVSYYGDIHQWTATSGETYWATVPNGGISAMAARPDGALATADSTQGRLVVFDANKQVVQDVSGVSKPGGMAFDAQGRLYVAANGNGQIVRIDAANSFPLTVTHLPGARDMTIDANGILYITAQTNWLYTLDPTSATVTTLGTMNGDLRGIALTSQGPLVASRGSSLIGRFDGTKIVGFAGGLANPSQVRLGPDGSLYAANSNGTLTRYHDGIMSVLVSGIPGAQSVAVAADGTAYVGGNLSGRIVQARPDGSTSDLGTQNLLLPSVVSLAPNRVGVVVGTGYPNGSVYELTVTPPPALPPPGTIVYQSSQLLNDIAPTDSPIAVDFGSFTPTLPGDYRFVVSDTQGSGSVVNYLHVGPSANGTLTASVTNVPPGDVQVPVTLQVTGADYTSLAKVDASQIKPVVTTPFFYAMTSDPAGNIYYTDGAGLHSVSPSGATQLLVGGYDARDVASDPQGRILFVGQDTTTHANQLVRYDLEGSVQVLYTASDDIRGMDVNSMGDAYLVVRNLGILVKVRPDGTNSVVMNAGLDGPTDLSFDGYDDLFIVTGVGRLLELQTDNTLHTVFATSDGVSTPFYDAEGYHPVAGDCDRNVFVSPASWTAVGPGSEQTFIAQVFPKTGRVGMVFNGALFGLTDMDLLYSDRFHNRLLTWNDESYTIMQIPIICGSMSVEAHVFSLPGQVLTGFSTPAGAVIPHTDGRSEYVFALNNVAPTGFTVGFNAPLSGLTLGQTAPVVDSAFLVYKNTFTNQDTKVPLTVPSVHVNNGVNLSVSTDQPQYAANSTAQITTWVIDPPGQAAMSGTVQVDVLDANNALVAHIATQDVTVAASGQIAVPGTFAVGTIIPGTYTARATMTNASVTLAQSTTTFAVVADNGAAEVTSQIAVDKLSYNPSDTATLISHVTDQSGNDILSNLSLTVTIADASNTTLFTHTYDIAQLLPNQTLQFSTPYVFQNLAPGTYTVTQQVTNTSNTVLDQHATSLTVTANTTQGLSATVQVTPSWVSPDQSLTCAVSVSNMATAPASNLPLRYGIVNLATGDFTTLGQDTPTLAHGAQWQNSAPVAGGTLTPGNYSCAVQLNGASGWQTLAYSSFADFYVANLSVGLSVRTPNIGPGHIQFYHLQITNTGPHAANNATIGVTLPPSVPWIESGPGTLSCTGNRANVSCTVPPLLVNDSADLCFAALVDTRGPGPLLASATGQDDGTTTINLGSNNSAGAQFNVVPESLYADGFDPCWFKTDVIYINGFNW